ncbi:MAG: UDP-glucose 4-epimerase GalE [Coriobacteriales bacterium]|jgi:UDP-glucose 4-epimerase|nr:UDP-glucose 4-epimerase GalE [Coriobacteriales bacterium]
MKVLVVGGAGYIGSHTSYELIRGGHEVVVLDNLSTGRFANVHPAARFYTADIRDREAIHQVFAAETAYGAFDVVMHFAAKLVVEESLCQPLAYYQNNVEGLRLLLDVMVEFQARRLVFSSSAAVYGQTTTSLCREDDPTLPINPYGETKLAAERMIHWVAQAHSMQYCILRYFNVAGADASLRIGLDKDQLTWLVPLIMQTALGQRDKFMVFGSDYDTPDGTCIRDYIHVTDLAEAHLLGAHYLMMGDQSLTANLGSGSGYSVLQVLQAALELFDFPYEFADRRPGDPARLVADTSRARTVLGWQPQLDLRTMLESDYSYRKTLLGQAEAGGTTMP